MALYAKDSARFVSAWSANPRNTYQCISCLQPVKYRRSKLQFPHFYHISKEPSCRLHGKSNQHLQIQLEIVKRFSGGVLEKRFPSIGRIADVVCEKEKLIFEVQCSRMTLKEATLRTQEYESLGYQLIWILDDSRFNRWRLKDAEIFMRKQNCYFVNRAMFFYDQVEIIRNKKRVSRGKKIPMNFKTLSQKGSLKPKIIEERAFLQKYIYAPYKRLFKKFILRM